MNAISLSQVVKRYGNHLALNGLSLTVPKGAICALIGPNGCGKTTTMGVVAGLLRTEAGTADILGLGPFSAKRHASRVSLMPQDAIPSLHVSIVECLRYYAELQGMAPDIAQKEASHWLYKVQLSDRKNARFDQLSHGMRRRFSVAQAFLGHPDLILLDEPTSGLDPELVVQIRELILQQRGEATLLVSSHILSELETMCDYAIFMEQGRVIRQGSMAELTSVGSIVRYTLSRSPDMRAIELRMQGCTLQWQAPTLTIRAPRSQSVEETNARCLPALLEQSVGILEISTGQSLEAAYMNLKANHQPRS
jgi:ABC-type multidrug transport system ATPase subunit